MQRKNVDTKYGRFSCYVSDVIEKGRATILFITCQGVSCAYHDFYHLINNIEDCNVVTIDLLGQGYSDSPIQKNRDLNTITDEMAEIINYYSDDNTYICVHSYSAIYVQNCIIEGKIKVKGMVGIDPTTSSIMLKYIEELDCNLKEVENIHHQKENGELPEQLEATFDENLPKELQMEAIECYRNNSGSIEEMSELRNARETLIRTQGQEMPSTIPTLSILSSMNYPDYCEMGNPYFNEHKNSIQMVLNGHHFIHWIHPERIADEIKSFIKHN